jgi:hypothetical protein
MTRRLLAVFFALLYTSLLAAQSNQPMAAGKSGEMIVQVISAAAKPGSEAQYIEGRKRHAEWHRSQNDPWTWHTYEIVSGEGIGVLLTVSSPHRWADRDPRQKFMADDQADVARNIAPYASHPVVSYWRVRSDMSRAGAPKADAAPTPYTTVVHFILNPDATPTFIENVKRISSALDKANAPGAKGLWYQLVNGGEGPHFVLVTQRKDWASFESPVVDDVLRQAAGAEGATMLSNLRKGMKRTWSEILHHNEELSYHPASAPTR